MEVQSLFSQLSQELVDEIIDHSADSKEVLLSCSLVSSKFLPRSQLHLFHNVSFTSDKDEHLLFTEEDRFSLRVKRTTAFLDIITKRPIISTYVRSLGISFLCLDESWMYTDHSFLEIMKTFPFLDTLCVKSYFHSGEHNITDADAFMNDFWIPFISPNITTLSIKLWTDFPPGIFFTCPKLNHLQLYLPEFGARNALAMANAKLTAPLRLESLSVTAAGTCLNALSSLRLQDGTPFLDLSSLKRLDCARYPRQLSTVIWVKNAMERIAPTLRELYLHLDYCFPDDDGKLRITLAGCTHLQSLHFHLDLFQKARIGFKTGEESFLALAHLISTAHKLGTICYLRFKISVVGRPPDAHPTAQDWLLGDWRPLDDAIFNLSKPSGKTITVEFDISLDPDINVDTQILDNLGTYCLPRTSSDPSYRLQCQYYPEE